MRLYGKMGWTLTKSQIQLECDEAYKYVYLI